MKRRFTLQIKDFTHAHIEEAMSIALQNYNEERSVTPALPEIESVPDLTPYAENGLGAAAFEGGQMVGFLCSVPPFGNAFRSTDAVGVFSPMGANGAIGLRGEVYSRLYQAAGEKWAAAGASSHAVCIYTHDLEAQQQFFRLGFGMRCVDAVRGMDSIHAKPCEEYEFSDCLPEELPRLFSLDHKLDAHMALSPCFMLRPSGTEASFEDEIKCGNPILITAKKGGEVIAFIRAEPDGETFIQDSPGYIHITGAYCLPDHRGRGVSQKLLSLLLSKLKNSGYTRLGVDFESINPPAYGFWLKYFAPYTGGLVRRIDEHSILSRQKQPCFLSLK